jgi:hypothetical protein
VHVGLAAVRAPLVAQVDADLQFLPEELPQLVEPLQAGRADLVLGSRFMRGSTRRPGSTPRIPTMENWITSAYASVLFGQRMTDILAGMKAWRGGAGLADAWVRLGAVWGSQGQFEKAASAIERALLCEPANVHPLLALRHNSKRGFRW